MTQGIFPVSFLLYNNIVMRSCNYHSIQTMGTLDGPGIRYVLFLQGCCFRCLFCHNPDTWSGQANSMTSDDFVSDVLKYKPFYDASGGGVTVSGGEPLLQIPFLIEAFKKLKDARMHTAIDTCGYVNITDDLKELMKYTNLIMLDIKHLNNDIHKELTGKPNDKVIKFLDFLAENDKNIRIRQVLTPGYTIEDEYITNLIKFLKNYRLEKVELLPYHDMAKDKYKKLGLEYKLNARIPTKEEVAKIKARFIEEGFDTI